MSSCTTSFAGAEGECPSVLVMRFVYSNEAIYISRFTCCAGIGLLRHSDASALCCCSLVSQSEYRFSPSFVNKAKRSLLCVTSIESETTVSAVLREFRLRIRGGRVGCIVTCA